jgi:hypothetical protein
LLDSVLRNECTFPSSELTFPAKSYNHLIARVLSRILLSRS